MRPQSPLPLHSTSSRLCIRSIFFTCFSGICSRKVQAIASRTRMGSCVALLPDLSRRRECAPLTTWPDQRCKPISKIRLNNIIALCMREYSQGIVRNPAATDTICDLEMLQMRLAHHANEKLKEQRAERACAFWLKSWKQLGPCSPTATSRSDTPTSAPSAAAAA